MKIGVYHSLQSMGGKVEFPTLIDETRELAEYCDSAGFDSFWLGEHHFNVWSRSLLGNPILMGADIASRTKQIRVGLAAVIATFWHPLRLAEDLALLDHLCRGRLEIGFGRGNYGLEALNLNPLADPNKPEENFSVFEDTVEIVKRAFTEERFSYKGKKYTIPTPGFKADIAHKVTDPRYVDPETGELNKLTVHPRPYQKPMPPLWQVVDSPSSIEWAGKHGLGVLLWRPTVRALKERFELHRRAMSESTGQVLVPGERAGVMRDCFVAESMAEARRVAGGAVMEVLNHSNWRGPKIYFDPGETITPEQEAALKKRLTFEFVEPRSLLFGSPDDVFEKLRELHEVTNLEQLIIHVNWVGLEHEHSMRCIRMFGEHVLPRVKKELVPRQKIAERLSA